jgi:subtilisin family serine protease
VKVLNKDGDGTSSGVVRAIDFVAQLKVANPTRPIVTSKLSCLGILLRKILFLILSLLYTDMSLGGSRSSSINNAVAAAINVGVVVVTSAGNDGFDACNKSPASVETAITVGAIDSKDSRATYSNYGSCVDVFA